MRHNHDIFSGGLYYFCLNNFDMDDDLGLNNLETVLLTSSPTLVKVVELGDVKFILDTGDLTAETPTGLK